MSTKQGYDQHHILHQHFPGDCCLCKAETKIHHLETELFLAKKEIHELKSKYEKKMEFKETP